MRTGRAEKPIPPASDPSTWSGLLWTGEAVAMAPEALGGFLPGTVDHGHDVAHDLREVEVLGRVDARHAGLEQRLGVGRRDDAAHHHRHLADACLRHTVEHVGHQRGVAARQDREADDVHALLEGGIDDAFRREPDAFVDDLHAAVARPHGDLLGAIRMAVQAGLADQDLDAPAEAARHGLDLAPGGFEAAVTDTGGARHAGGRAVFAEHAAPRLGPFAGG